MPYGLDEKEEYHTYRKIGNSKKYYTSQKSDSDCKNFLWYSQWHDYIKDKIEHFSKKEKNNFFRYLNRKIRQNEYCRDILNSIAGPIYVMLISIVVSVFLNNDIDGAFILYLTGVLCSGTIVVLAI